MIGRLLILPPFH